MTPRQRRIGAVVGGLASFGLATALALRALDRNVAFYLTPSQVAAGEAPAGRAFRVGGLVSPGSLQRDGLSVRFALGDGARAVVVRYTGILPDLFREGRGAVVQGRLAADGGFDATEVLAKHDETYVPPPAARALASAAAASAAKATVPGPAR